MVGGLDMVFDRGRIAQRTTERDVRAQVLRVARPVDPQRNSESEGAAKAALSFR
jgi:hypothetical protein